MITEMARVFEYDRKGRKYMKDMKMGRRWRVTSLGKKVRKPKKDSGTQAQEVKVEKRKRDYIQAPWHCEKSGSTRRAQTS